MVVQTYIRIRILFSSPLPLDIRFESCVGLFLSSTFGRPGPLATWKFPRVVFSAQRIANPARNPLPASLLLRGGGSMDIQMAKVKNGPTRAGGKTAPRE